MKNIFGTMLLYAELVALAFIVFVPIVYTIGTSLSPNSGILNTIWPDNPSLINYKFLLEGSRVIGGLEETTNFKKWYWNTLQVAIMTMIGAVLFVTGTAYVFSRYKFKGKKVGLLMILVLQMFPSFLALIALFTLFQTFGLTNEPRALTIIYVSGSIPFNIWLIKGYLQNIPKELDESAKIDGANKIQIFFKIILPLSVPIISFVAVTQFMAPWMDYILPSFLIVDNEKWTLAVGIFDFINDASDTNYPAFAAAAIIVAVPITILYITFQRYLIEGITAGANKG
ncbi:MAG: sugar ABC transporter permease [Candidatus Izimaplasma sp.]|nr:sugar ABC transporter permease [Candidatus Izimaplasma bacterium]